MKSVRYILTSLLVAASAAAAIAASTPTVTTTDNTKWTAGTGGYKGTQIAVLLGDPTKSGMYIMRMKLPAGTVFPPHTHGGTENVTVISGTVWFAGGKKLDKNSMKAYAAGTFVTIPANFPHSAMTKEEAVIQIEGMGPESMTPVKP
jgi:quercetin dioxygenase-like cupin family protein